MRAPVPPIPGGGADFNQFMVLEGSGRFGQITSLTPLSPTRMRDSRVVSEGAGQLALSLRPTGVLSGLHAGFRAVGGQKDAVSSPRPSGEGEHHSRVDAGDGWIHDHLSDPYVQKAAAQDQDRSRATHKLLGKKHRVCAPARSSQDHGAAPGRPGPKRLPRR